MAERTTDGKFAKGHTRIENSGSKKGYKYQSTKMREFIFEFFNNRSEDLCEAWEQLEPKEKWDTTCKMMKYMLPAITAISFEDFSENNTMQDIIKFAFQTRKERLGY